jgi:hypothetical protein
MLQPYTEEQVLEYLTLAKRTEVMQLLADDPDLMTLARSPLELSMIVLAYVKEEFAKLVAAQANSYSEKRRILFDLFIRNMVERSHRHKKRIGATPEEDVSCHTLLKEQEVQKSYRYLGWIAQTMASKNLQKLSPSNLYPVLSEMDKKTAHRDKLAQQINLMLTGIGLLAAFVITLFKYSVPVAGLIPLAVLVCCWSRSGNLFRKGLVRDIVSAIAGFPLAGLMGAVLYNLTANTDADRFTSYLFLFFPAILTFIPVLLVRPDTFISKKPIIPVFVQRLTLPLSFIAIPFAAIILMRSFWLLKFGIIYLLSAIVFMWTFARSHFHDRKINMYVLASAIALYTTSATFVGLRYYTNSSLTVVWLLEAIMAAGVLTFGGIVGNAAIGFVTGFLIAVFFSFFFRAPITLALGFGAMVGVSLLFSFVLKRGYLEFANWATLIMLKLQGKLPLRLGRFLKNAENDLLMSRNGREHQFSHRLIRDHYAIHDLVPQLATDDDAVRLQAVRKLLGLNDASCDILLELIDDHSAEIRYSCIEGLGKIGNLKSANGLTRIMKATIGTLQSHAATALGETKDIGAVKVLIGVCENYPADSYEFASAMKALFRLQRLSAWENTAKIQTYLATAYVRMEEADYIRFELLRRQLGEKVEDEWLNHLEHFASRSGELPIHDLLVKQSLKKLIKSNKAGVMRLSLKAYLKVDPEACVRELLSNNQVLSMDFSWNFYRDTDLKDSIILAVRQYVKATGPNDLAFYILSQLHAQSSFSAISLMLGSPNQAIQIEGLNCLNWNLQPLNRKNLLRLLFMPAAWKIATSDLPKLVNSASIEVRTEAVSLIIGHPLPFLKNTSGNFLSNRPTGQGSPTYCTRSLNIKGA